MKTFFAFFENYRGTYKIFKKLPRISFILWLVLGAVMFVYDAVDWITDFALIWLIVGAFVGTISALVTSIMISPIVVIADSKLEENNSEE